MAKFFYSIFFFGLFSAGCGSNAPAPATAITRDTSATTTTRDTSIVRDFLKWYALHHKQIESFQLVDLPTSPDSGYYKVNYANVAQYIAALRSSGLFTDSFLADKYSYFQECDKKMAAAKQNDGPPEGLDADLLLYNQAPDEVLKEYPSLKIRTIPVDTKGNHQVQLETADNYLLFTILEMPDKCCINRIKFQEKARL